MGEIHPHYMKKTAAIGGRNLIGSRLRELRLAQKPEVTLEDLAGRLAARGVHLDRSAIGRIENQNRYVLDYELKALADALRTDLREFFR
jgi:transcriptional regulator with XRE-family HTH domain